jgi:hypothetical protein
MNAMKGAFPGWPSHPTLCALVVVLLLGAVSCGHPRSSETTKKAPSPPSEIKDPIISMMMASSIDAKGELVNPRFSFPQTEPQITAIVQVGNVKGSQLTVTWYKTSDDGDEKLFEHQIQVKSHDRAFSVAKNPGGIFAAGTYKVVATLEGQTKDTEFDITPPKAAQNKTSNNREESHFEDQAELKNDRTVSVETNSDGLLQAISYEPVPDQGHMQKVALNASSGTTPAMPTGSTAAKGKPPVGGQSGTVPPSGATQNGGMGVPKGPWISQSGDLFICADERCSPDFVDSTADRVEVYVFSSVPSQELIQAWEGPSSEHQLGLAKSGTDGTLKFDPCWAPDKDLPGTKLSFTARLGNETVTTQVTLGDDTLAPRVNVVSTPARGTKVKTGDKINLKVTATEKRSGGPWQTGVKVIQITAQPGGLVKDPWVNPSALPKACEEKTWEQKDEATYTVPKKPPPIIKICALAEDYVGNESSQCGEFYAGHVWKGTDDYRLSQQLPAGLQLSTGHVDFTLGEDEQGRLKGTAEGWVTADLYFPLCRSTTKQPGKLHAQLDGSRNERGMELHITSITWEPIQITPCGPGGIPGVIGGGKILLLDEALQRLERRTEDEYGYEHEETVPYPMVPYTVRHAVLLRRVN